jgi:hypothetical protein
MRKEVYNGSYHGFYRSNIFPRFIASQEGFEEIFSGGPADLFVGHLCRQGVTVKYRTYGQARGIFDNTGKYAGVVLFGNSDGIGEVEKMIAEGEKRHKTAVRILRRRVEHGHKLNPVDLLGV